jgi:hypothetical protein
LTAHETIDLPPADNLHMAFQDADLVPQHHQLGLLSGAVAQGCKGDVDEEPEAGVKSEEEHGRRLIVAGLGGSPLSPDGLSAPHRRRFESSVRHRGLNGSLSWPHRLALTWLHLSVEPPGTMPVCPRRHSPAIDLRSAFSAAARSMLAR